MNIKHIFDDFFMKKAFFVCIVFASPQSSLRFALRELLVEATPTPTGKAMRGRLNESTPTGKIYAKPPFTSSLPQKKFIFY